LSVPDKIKWINSWEVSMEIAKILSEEKTKKVVERLYSEGD